MLVMLLKRKGGDNMQFIDEQKFKKDIGIYKITNLVNGMVYIGQTKQGFQKRYWLHRWKLRNGSHDNQYLQNAWNKYGEENFEFSIVEVLKIQEIDEKERYWISFYKEQNKCYSIQDGGQPTRLNDFVTKEGRKLVGEKNRQRLLGTKLSEETKIKMSNSRKGKFVKKKTQKITLEQAKEVKERLIQGYTPKEIMEDLGIEYKPINGIISANTWSHVFVEGWDDFQSNRKKGKGISSVGRKCNRKSKISLEEAKMYYEKYIELNSLAKTADFFQVSIGVVRKRIKIYKQALCESCAKPQFEEGATTIRKE